MGGGGPGARAACVSAGRAVRIANPSVWVQSCGSDGREIHLL